MIFCYNCGRRLSEHDFCTSCGADVSLYKKVMHVSNMYYNEGLEKAGVRDLSGAVACLRQSLQFNKNNIKARNLLGLVYFEMGEAATALREWVISKNMSPEKNIADEYIDKVRSNSTRLDSINQTAKKYNRALALCNQDSKDLAVIQLRKVLSMNPRFIRAHQLLALLYMEQEEWDRAERELRKCMEIDKNNLQTLRYLKEVEQALMPDEGVKRRRKEETVRYQSENEIIIQPLNVREPKRGGGFSTVLNMIIGLIIGVAAMYFLVVPAAQSRVRNEEQQTITKISSESDAKTARIQELEGQIEGLNGNVQDLRTEIEGYAGTGGTIQVTESLLQIAAEYTETEDKQAAADQLEALAGQVDMAAMPQGFQRLYQSMNAAIGPDLSEEYYEVGYQQYYTGRYEEAVETLSKAVKYDAANADALYHLGEAYRSSGDTANAITTYDKVIELFPDTENARLAKYRKDNLNAG
ncbi:tetratricopeptide repeat protein [uncultured Acetatifactor sp.]|jgi:tetratricopeptide (TPR) repeat protein|uniref:tetratricopeptide repeat protein n=1 Tax=uncultured Acetatifactor sp. TaxID=1671927 RepID=UPI0026039006|nr:tetratricopeptide repeat protein [uncultured Acetatifactor sp.]